MFQRYMFLIITHDCFSRFRVVRSIFCMVARSECTGTAGSGSMRWSRGACPAGGRAPADTAPPSASSWRCSPGRGRGARPCTNTMLIQHLTPVTAVRRTLLITRCTLNTTLLTRPRWRGPLSACLAARKVHIIGQDRVSTLLQCIHAPPC